MISGEQGPWNDKGQMETWINELITTCVAKNGEGRKKIEVPEFLGKYIKWDTLMLIDMHVRIAFTGTPREAETVWNRCVEEVHLSLYQSRMKFKLEQCGYGGLM